MTLKENFGTRIKELRESVLMTQEELAERLGIHRNTLARIENGKHFVTDKTLEKMTTVLGVEYCDLFKFNNSEVKQDIKKALKIKLAELDEIDSDYFLSNITAFLKAKRKHL